jgi:outer membrane lipoprotein-sorting protein
LVTFAVSVPKMAEMPDPATDKPQATYFRVFETVAFARKDGLPRRLVAVSEVPGEGPLGDRELTILYRNVQVNEPIPAGTFQVRVPEGYEVGALQGQQAAPAPAP